MPTSQVVVTRHSGKIERGIPVPLVVEKTQAVGIGGLDTRECLLEPAPFMGYPFDHGCALWTPVRHEPGDGVLREPMRRPKNSQGKKRDNDRPISSLLRQTPSSLCLEHVSAPSVVDRSLSPEASRVPALEKLSFLVVFKKIYRGRE